MCLFEDDRSQVDTFFCENGEPKERAKVLEDIYFAMDRALRFGQNWAYMQNFRLHQVELTLPRQAEAKKEAIAKILEEILCRDVAGHIVWVAFLPHQNGGVTKDTAAVVQRR